MNSKVIYRQQLTRCGKQRCRKCKEGAGHGPYWYACWSENGRTISKYIGIRLPADIEIAQQAKKGKLNTPGGRAEVAATSQIGELSFVLRIYVLGQLRIERRNGHEWQAVAHRTWHRRRARALLGCLLSHSGRRMGREQIIDALWPDIDIETAANRLNGAVHELRQILEPEIARPADSRMLRLERDVLELADRTHIWVDAEAFEGLLKQAHTCTDTEQTECLLEQAEALYGGDYLLEELYSEWAIPRRQALRHSWMGLLLDLSDLRATRGAFTSAIEPLNRLLATDPINEAAVQRLMSLLTQLDRRGEALQVYQQLALKLQRDEGTDPLPETSELYEALRLGHLQIAPAPQTKIATIQSQPSIQPSNGKHNDKSAASSDAKVDLHSRQATQGMPFSLTGTWQLSRHNQSPLVGRNRELDTMRQLVRSIEGTSKSGDTAPSERNPDFVLLMGEPGIGKTRLAEELSHDVKTHGWAVVWSRSYEQEGTIPYRLWRELLRALLQDVPREFLLSSMKMYIPGFEEAANAKLERLNALLTAPDYTAVCDVLPRSSLVTVEASLQPLPPEQERLHLWAATLELLSALSKHTPLLLVLDDLHWTDESSLDLLAYLVRRLQGQRILLVGTCRDEELPPTHNLRTLITDLRREQAAVTLSLQPLTQSQIGSLVAHLPQSIVQSIQTQAAGNPFFAEELARLSSPELETHSSLPETIATVLERRLSRLSNECQVLLGKAAVLGGSFELNQLLSMSSDARYQEDAILDLLEEALHAGLLTEKGTEARITYHFWHPLIVSHLYERLSAAQ